MKKYAEKFYLSDGWRRTRNAYYKYKCGLCERCGKPGDIVHHRIYISPQNIHDRNITLNFANLELLCIECHNKEHLATPKRYSFDENGRLVPPVFQKRNGG